VWNVGDWDDSSMLLNLGQSADPRSPHYRDHLEPWRSGAGLRLPFTREGVDAGCVRRVVIAAPAAPSNQVAAAESVT
jgi:penicillin amidase